MFFTTTTGHRITLDHFFVGEANVMLDRDQTDHHVAFSGLMSRLFPDSTYHVVIDETRECQGAFACVAAFSTMEFRHDSDALGSSLLLGWYVDHQDRHLRDIVKIGLDLCNWEIVSTPIYWS